MNNTYEINLRKYSREIKELDGEFGDFWKKRRKATTEQFEKDAYVSNGIVRWNLNHKVPPAEILTIWKYSGKKFDYESSILESENEMKRIIDEYRANPPKVTDEELYEMQAAFGAGAKIIDVITGKEMVV